MTLVYTSTRIVFSRIRMKNIEATRHSHGRLNSGIWSYSSLRCVSNNTETSQNIEMDQTEQEMLSVPRRKACQEDSECASRAHMSLAAVRL